MLAFMTDATTRTAPPTPRLWAPGGFREDDWTHADSLDGPGGNGRVILPLQAFLDLDPDIRASAAERLGVMLQPGDAVEKIAPLLDQLALVALAFPAFSDGRSFSKAELLRGRHGFAGAIRATGEVLPDQLPHMLRLGFNEFEVSHPVLIRRLEASDTGGLGLYYQPAETAEKAGETYSWRRRR